jgi:hypothetical protein
MKNCLSVYLVKDRVIIPAQTMTTGGSYLETEPVAVRDIADDAGIVDAILSELAQERPVIPAPSRDNWPKPVVLAPAGVKTWGALEKTGRSWPVQFFGNQWHIVPSRTNAKGKWENDLEAQVLLPADIPADQLARRVAELVKNAYTPA